MKPSEVIPKVLELGDAISLYWETELPKRHPDYPFVNEGDDDGPPPPEEAKLRKLLHSLPEEYLYLFILIAEIGSRRYGTKDLSKSFQDVKDRFETVEYAITHIMACPPFDSYLADGLEVLKKDKINTDKMLPKTKTTQQSEALRIGRKAMKPSEVIPKVLKLAETISLYWETELPKRHPDYPIDHEGEDDGPPPPEEEKLRKLLLSLPEEYLYLIHLIAEIGRGRYREKDYSKRYQEVKAEYQNAEDAILRIMECPPFEMHLADGLEVLKENNMNLDKMLPKGKTTRR